MIRFLAVLVALIGLGAGMAQAQSRDDLVQGQPGLPALYDVTGVELDDVLNLRDAPRASARQIATLAPTASGIEVTAVSDNGDWGRVLLPEGVAWANMQFLTPQPGTELPFMSRPMVCFGTEPFWSVTLDPAVPATLDRMGTEPEAFRMGLPMRDPNRSEAVLGNAESGVSMVAVVRPAQCSDGMSDALYGLKTEVILLGADGAEMLTGCCSLTMR